MHSFYCPELKAGDLVLPDDEAHHLAHVLRLPKGDRVRLIDGKGSAADAEIISIGKREVCLHAGPLLYNEPAHPRLHIGIAPTKNIDRFEWFLEKATETGVSTITPLLCRRSERKEIRTDRLSKLLVSASKQSGRMWFPVLNEMTQFSRFVSSVQESSRWMAWCGETEKTSVAVAFATKEDTVVLIGPEGDFDFQEVQEAEAAGFRNLSLGELRLRTETAGIYASVAFSCLKTNL